MSNKHFFNLETFKPQKSYEGGSRTSITSNEVSAFEGISLECLKLNKGCAQEPLWHPNAHKIGYCLQGNALITLFCPDFHDTFTVNEGEIFFIPKGYLHHIANCGEKELIINCALNNTKPDELYLSNAVRSLSDSAFAATFHTAPPFFEGLKKAKKDTLIASCLQKKLPGNVTSRFKFDIKASNALLTTAGGYLKAATKQNLAVLQGLGILTFGLKEKGIVEPHWHTNAGELIYIMKGRVRIAILSPDGSLDAAEVKAGGGAFAPPSHFHSIENIGPEDVEVIAFFNDPSPDYIGIGEAVGVFSNEVLASTFNLSPEYFSSFKAPQGPIVIAGGRELVSAGREIYNR